MQNKSSASVVRCVLLSLLTVCTGVIQAQDEKAPFDRAKAGDGGLGMPTPYDKFLALDQALPGGKVDWAKVARSLSKSWDTDQIKDTEVAVPIALGIRIADGVMTVKAKDAEQLNKCASDIEKLAKKLGVGDAEMSRARAVRAAANKGNWLKVFMELGFFQQDIMKKIADEKDPTRSTLIIASGWVQGLRYTSNVVDANYSAPVSNILREPLLVKSLVDKVSQLPAKVQNTAQVTKLSQALGTIAKLVDVPTDGSITQENVKKLSQISTEVVESAGSTSR